MATKPLAMNTREVAELFDTSVNTVYRRVADGTFPVMPFRLGRDWKFSRPLIERFLADPEHGPVRP